MPKYAKVDAQGKITEVSDQPKQGFQPTQDNAKIGDTHREPGQQGGQGSQGQQNQDR